MNIRKLLPHVGACLLLFASHSAVADFVHPGGLFKQSDLERMRYMVEVGAEPWASSFDTLREQKHASKHYVVRGNSSWTVVDREKKINHKEFESDVQAAWLNALMWGITQDEDHAKKCVEIFNTWKNLTEMTGTGTAPLNAGLFSWKLVEAAEIIKSTYNGWAEKDLQQFKDMLVYPGYSDKGIPSEVSDHNGTFYWRIVNGDPKRHGNQDMIAWRAMITMGVFLDNKKMYDRALRYFKGLPHRSDDIPYASGSPKEKSKKKENKFFNTYQVKRESDTPDYGYNGVLKHYIWENGQLQESSRDQQHALFGLGVASGIAEVAWNQGDPVWNSLDNRILKGFEFSSRYNISYIQAFSDQQSPWEPEKFIKRKDRTGRWQSKSMNPHFENDFEKVSRGKIKNRPVFEQAAAHFDVRMGLKDKAKWTLRGRDVAINEYGHEKSGKSLDHPGWGALTFRRPEGTAGDPIKGFVNNTPQFSIPVLPAVILAENFDYFPDSGEGRVYHDSTPGNSRKQYRNTDVDIVTATGGFAISNLSKGEWLNYTLHAPREKEFALYLRYRSAGNGAAVKFTINGKQLGRETKLPASDGKWKTQLIAHRLKLDAGVQTLRLHITGEAKGFQINSFQFAKKIDVPKGYRLCAQERDHCQFEGTKAVAFGTHKKLKYAEVNDGVWCGTWQFGDPDPGKNKACFIDKYGPPKGFRLCSLERERCEFEGTRKVAFGSGGKYSYAVATDGIWCGTGSFGDPLPGRTKACFIPIK